MHGALPKMGGSLERQLCKARKGLAGAVRSADAVQVCPFGPTCGGRRLSDRSRTGVSKEGISGYFGGNTESRAAKAGRKAAFQRSGAPGCIRSPALGRRAAGIHFRRGTQPPLCMPCRTYGESCTHGDMADAGRLNAAPACSGLLRFGFRRTGMSKEKISRFLKEGF